MQQLTLCQQRPHDPACYHPPAPGTGSAAPAAAALILLLYFTPTIVAFIRKVPHVRLVAVVNALLGWTLIGWLARWRLGGAALWPSFRIWHHASLPLASARDD